MSTPVYNIHELAQFAKFALTPNEEHLFRENIQCILAEVEKLHDVDTTGILGTHIVTGLHTITRADHAHPATLRTELLAAMPCARHDFLEVPPFFKGKKEKSAPLSAAHSV